MNSTTIPVMKTIHWFTDSVCFSHAFVSAKIRLLLNLLLPEKMSAAKQAVNTGCWTPDGTQRTATETPATASETPKSGSNNVGKKSRERKRKSLGQDFASAWPEDSNSESGIYSIILVIILIA